MKDYEVLNVGNWLEKTVFYEIYPQSYYDSNGDGIGDIPGITAKLDYILSLGCNALWLNPCFLSPFGDAGYDVSDYKLVAPRYGTNEDMKTLFTEAHKRNMHVILDLVPGHTSVDHPWFKESCKAEKNDFSGRYIWTDSVWKDTSNYGGISGSLRGISNRDGCVAVNFFSHQPALNYGFANRTESWQSSVDSPEALATRQAMKDVMDFWLSAGCDGFRIDMAGSLVKDDPDSIETIKLWQDVRNFMDAKYPDAVMVSEWGEPDKSLAAGFHMDFLLQFGPSHYNDLFRCQNPYFSREGKGDASEFIAYYIKNYQKTNGNGLMCVPSGNHDMVRLAQFLNPEEIKIAYSFLLSVPGVPFIYYGDEIGMRYLNVTSVEGGYERTGARSPMQWNHDKNYGFSTAAPDQLYIQQDMAEDAPVVSDQIKQEDSIWNEVQKLIAVRKSHSALCASGKIEFISNGSKYPLVYLRYDDQEQILVVINPSQNDASIVCPYKVQEIIYNLGGKPRIEDGIMIVPQESAAFILL